MDVPGEDARRARWWEDNRSAWDEWADLHVGTAFYDVESFVAGRSSLRPFEVEEVGAVDGRSLCHLQCHFGQDTLSWARLGARVVGVDFSPKAIAAAAALAAAVGLEDRSEFVTADVYDAVDAVGGRQFDVVYTGIGALAWLPDIGRWGRTVAALLAPGGFVYLAELHPLGSVLDGELRATSDYFYDPAGKHYDFSGSYADWDAPTVHTRKHEWQHPVSDVIGSLLDAGLRLDLFRELDFTLFENWGLLEPQGDGTWRLPADRPRLPLLYSLRATKPG